MDTSERRRILIAQHQKADLAFAERFLRLIGGYEVHSATDGKGLIRALKARPDLILTDTAAPGLFLRAVEIVRRTDAFKDVPIVAYSHEQHLVETCVAKGMSGFIVKPASPAGLLGKVWRILGEESANAAAGFAQQFRQDIDRIDNLPTLPAVFAEVDRLCQDEEVGADELSPVIESDPSISLKLLSLANSAFFGFSRRINTVHEAISLLGNKTVKNAVLNIAVFEATKDLKTSAGLDKSAFWIHATGVGSVARFLADRLKIDRDEVFTAGIVHDMGKLIFDALYTDFYRDVLAHVVSDGGSLFDAEKQIIGLTHCGVGSELCEAWNLGPELVAAVAHHHQPGKAGGEEEIASLIHLGNVIARKFGFGYGGDDTRPEPDGDALARLKLSASRIDEWESDIRAAFEKDRSILSILKS